MPIRLLSPGTVFEAIDSVIWGGLAVSEGASSITRGEINGWAGISAENVLRAIPSVGSSYVFNGVGIPGPLTQEGGPTPDDMYIDDPEAPQPPPWD